MAATIDPLRRIAALDYDRPGGRAAVTLPGTGFERERPGGGDVNRRRDPLIHDLFGRGRVVSFEELPVGRLARELEAQPPADRDVVRPIGRDFIALVAGNGGVLGEASSLDGGLRRRSGPFACCCRRAKQYCERY